MKPIYITSAFILYALSVASLSATPFTELEHNQAKKLVNDGKILPFDVVLAKVEGYCSVKLLDAHLYQTQGQWHYHLQLRSPQGELISLKMDASTGKLTDTTELPSSCQHDKK